MTDQNKSNFLDSPRSAKIALWAGIGFSLVFTFLIWWGGRYLTSVPLLADTGASWYYWKLPVRNFLGMFIDGGIKKIIIAAYPYPFNICSVFFS